MFSAFAPNGIAEQYIYDVLEIYLNNIDETGVLSLSAEDSSTLKYIAYQHTLQAGKAVHYARAILDIIVEFDGETFESGKTGKADNNATIYPNPTYGFLNIENVNAGEFILYTLDGVLLMQKTLMDDNESVKIDISKYASGIYVYKIVSSDYSTISSGKIFKN